MNPWAWALVFALLALPGVAVANTGIPAVAMTHWTGIYLFPLIVYLEGRVYKDAGVERPFRTATMLNGISTVVGVVTSLPFVNMMVETPGGMMFWARARSSTPMLGRALTAVVIVFVFLGFNYAITVLVERWADRKVYTKDGPHRPEVITKANQRSYGFLAVLLGIYGAWMVWTAYRLDNG